MIRLTISDEDREAIAEALDDPSIDERVKRKLMTVRMHELNVPHNTIAKTLNISDDTVTNYLKLYEQEGLSGLLESRYFQPVSKAAPYFEQIKNSLDEHPVSTLKEASARIKQISGLEFSETQTRRIMQQLGLQYRKAAAVPSGADPQLQCDFLAQELLPRVEEAKKGERRVFFVDASHFVMGVFLGTMPLRNSPGNAL